MKKTFLFTNLRTTILLSFTLFVSPYLRSQVINTIAGNGTAAYGGDGSAATAAMLNGPVGVAVDGSGNVYISDNGNNRVRKINSSGVISTYVGTGTSGYSGDGAAASLATLCHPSGIAVDASGNLFIADSWNSVVRKVNTSGIISTVAGNGSCPGRWYGCPGYVGDGGPATAAGLSNPVDVAVDRSGNLYISVCGDAEIRKVNTSGIISTIVGSPSMTANAWWANGVPATTTSVFGLSGVACDASGNLYFSDRMASILRKINSSGVISTIAGIVDSVGYVGGRGYSGDGGPAITAKLNNPGRIVLDATGNIFFTDMDNNCVRKINTSGIISTIAGTGVAGFSGDGSAAVAAKMSSPVGLAIDAHGNLYVADSLNNRIRKIGTSGVWVSKMKNSIGKMKLYPNPSTGSFTIEIPETNAASVKINIFDISGRVVDSRTVAGVLGLKETFILKNIVPGTYIALVDADGEVIQETVEIK